MAGPADQAGAPKPGDPGFLDWVRSHSGLSIDADGVFRYEGAPVEHPRVVTLFKKGLGRAADGRVTLTVGKTWCFVDTTGPLFVVKRAWVEGDALVLAIDDGSEERIGADEGSAGSAALELDTSGVLRARVRGGAEWARFTSEAQAMVASLVEERDGRYGLRVGAGVVRVGG